MSLHSWPRHHGLERIDFVDKHWAPEDFSILEVWGDPETGMLYYGEDHGCYCCQSPFDGQKREDLVLIDDIKVFAKAAREWGQNDYHTGTRVFTKLGAMMIRIANFEERFKIEIDTAELIESLDTEPALNDEN